MRESPRKEAVLLVGHGTTESNGIEAFMRMADSVRSRSRFPFVQPAFLELAQPPIPEGVGCCVAAGFLKILVLPIFLFQGRDVKLKIPKELTLAKTHHPQAELLVKRHLDGDQRLIDILLQHLAESKDQVACRLDKLAVLLVGRGSLDESMVSDMEKVTSLFASQSGIRYVTYCFTDITKPTIAEKVDWCVSQGAKGILILPYLLFPGVVIKKIQQQVKEALGRPPGIPMVVASCLGAHPKLVDVVISRAEEGC